MSTNTTIIFFGLHLKCFYVHGILLLPSQNDMKGILVQYLCNYKIYSCSFNNLPPSGSRNLLLACSRAVHRQQACQLRPNHEDQRLLAHWTWRHCRNLHQGARHRLRGGGDDHWVRRGAIPATQERDDRSDADGERVVPYPHHVVRH